MLFITALESIIEEKLVRFYNFSLCLENESNTYIERNFGLSLDGKLEGRVRVSDVVHFNENDEGLLLPR